MLNIFNIIEEEKYNYIDNYIKNNLSNTGEKDNYTIVIYNINKNIYNNLLNNIDTEYDNISHDDLENNETNPSYGILPIKILSFNNTLINIKYNAKKKDGIKSDLIKFIENFNIKKYDIYFSSKTKFVYINIINNYDLNKIRHELLGEWKNFYLFFKKSLINEDENKLINIVNNESCKNLNKILTNTKYNIRYQNSFSLEDLITGITI